MKIVLIGAGSYVFAPTVLRDVVERHRIEGEVAMVDLDLDAAQIMADVGRRMAEEARVPCRFTSTADRCEALPGADFVILSASPQGARRWAMDYEVLVRHGMPDQGRECGGLGGLSNALRSITVALDIARDMERLCPSALLLDVTNPMPRVVDAVNRFSAIRCYGFCNAAQRGKTGFEWLARTAGLRRDSIKAVTAGTNHFSWVVSVKERSNGADLLPRIIAAVRAGTDHESLLLRKWLDQYGALAACGPHHTAEFLPFDADASYTTRPPYHGNEEERRKRWDELRAVADGRKAFRDADTIVSWEHPVDMTVALYYNRPFRLPMVNLPNDGALDGVPPGRIVEVPARVGEGKVVAEKVNLPGSIAPLCGIVAEVHRLVAEGAAHGDRATLHAAIDLDPAIERKADAIRVLDELLALHRDMLPQFG